MISEAERILAAKHEARTDNEPPMLSPHLWEALWSDPEALSTLLESGANCAASLNYHDSEDEDYDDDDAI